VTRRYRYVVYYYVDDAQDEVADLAVQLGACERQFIDD